MTIAITSPTAESDAKDERRSWLAISLGTVIVTISFWSFMYAFLSDAAGDRSQPLAAAAFGMALVPLAFIVVAFGSGHPAAPLAVVKAMAVSVIVGLPVLALIGDGVTGLVSGFGAGAVIALRPMVHTRMSMRWCGVAVAATLAFVLTVVFPPLGLATAPSLAMTSVGLADRIRSR